MVLPEGSTQGRSIAAFAGCHVSIIENVRVDSAYALEYQNVAPGGNYTAGPVRCIGGLFGGCFAAVTTLERNKPRIRGRP